jgi:cytochrome d ubiquinol oxidase subunit I
MRFADVVVAAGAWAGPEVVPTRGQMATTLEFHIILACLGIALPTFVLLAEFMGLRRSNEVALVLARRWSQAMGVLVAVGAVTGTVRSFEMGLLRPGLMRQYGAVLGFPFGVEGLFFFLEAIFTAIYLYGWRRLPGWIQLVNCGHPPALRLSTDGELSPLAPATFTAPLGLHPDLHLSTFSAGPS